MGAVYKGSQPSLDRDVAIKVLPREVGEDPEFRESFTTEAKAMARFNHPNLTGVFDYGDIEGMPYIVMEYVNGCTLHELAWNQVVDPKQATAIVKGICDGLAHAHEHGISHRDIKPANILLTDKVEAKIGDFGLAHSVDSDTTGLVMGTPGYTAPEVYEDPEQAGPLADIYAAGIILHQLLTGIDPSGSEGPPTKTTGNLRLDAIWRKATHVDPAQRYQDIATMAAELERICNGPLTTKTMNRLVNSPGSTGMPRALSSVGSVRPVHVQSDGTAVKLIITIIIIAIAVMAFIMIMGGNQGGTNNSPNQTKPNDVLTLPE